MFVRGTQNGERWQPFIRAARSSRLGLYQDIKRTPASGTFRELITGRELSVFPSVAHYERGEVFLTRMMQAGDLIFMFGDSKCFPRERKRHIEEIVLDKMCALLELEDSVQGQYEKFMKVAGPYWMSCVASDHDVPILDPEHYREYLSSARRRWHEAVAGFRSGGDFARFSESRSLIQRARTYTAAHAAWARSQRARGVRARRAVDGSTL